MSWKFYRETFLEKGPQQSCSLGYDTHVQKKGGSSHNIAIVLCATTLFSQNTGWRNIYGRTIYLLGRRGKKGVRTSSHVWWESKETIILYKRLTELRECSWQLQSILLLWCGYTALAWPRHFCLLPRWEKIICSTEQWKLVGKKKRPVL